MKDTYILMHKDAPCGALAVDPDSGALVEFAVTEKDYAPFLGNADERLMKIWWKHRAVPGSRKDIVEAIRKAGCETNEEYLAKNLALSLTDCYWICPANLDLQWDDVSTSYDPNASLGGEKDKFWDVSTEPPMLIKKAYRNNGQQSINEAFATSLHAMQDSDIPFVSYETDQGDDGAILSKCAAFTSESIEFVSAYEVLRSGKSKSSRSDFDYYLDVCESCGIDRGLMQRTMDYMILSDFAISNVDEHLGNFGLLRNSDTMEIIGPAPIFDSGNSMFFNLPAGVPLGRKELLSLEISSFHAKEEKMLHHVADRNALDADRLPDPDWVAEFYTGYGQNEKRAAFIAESYAAKLSLLHDFGKGISISLYHETHR